MAWRYCSITNETKQACCTIVQEDYCSGGSIFLMATKPKESQQNVFHRELTPRTCGGSLQERSFVGWLYFCFSFSLAMDAAEMEAASKVVPDSDLEDVVFGAWC